MDTKNELKEWTWNEARKADVLPIEWLDLRFTNLYGANLDRANLDGASLYRANLDGASLYGANLDRANLDGASLYRANLDGASLDRANLDGANLYRANLDGASLDRANLDGASLDGAILNGASLNGASLNGASLNGASLNEANISGTSGLLSSAKWIDANFEKIERGVVVYKRFGKTSYKQPESWKIESGSVITEVCNPCRTIECGNGINFGTLEWCEKNYRNAELWKCLIEWIDLAGVVVPYNTDGKARCERMTLIEKIEA